MTEKTITKMMLDRSKHKEKVKPLLIATMKSLEEQEFTQEEAVEFASLLNRAVEDSNLMSLKQKFRACHLCDS